MTIGDVLALIAGVVSVCVSVWALLMGTALLFTRRTAAARTRLENHPLRALGIGALIVAVGGVGGVVLLNQPNGLLKLFGWALLLGLLAVSALGGGGLVLLASDRVRGMEPRFSAFAALGRGAGLLVVAGLVPLLGWFLIAPLMLVASLGAGCQALLRRDDTTRPDPPRDSSPPSQGSPPPRIAPLPAATSGGMEAAC